ncbi:MAG: phospholipid carrier-dependent glycosyltransferase [Gemmataceae bacterium]|nr:phospholipid carrier-dependent glycosyltransferase [Gemmataceae bacterium]
MSRADVASVLAAAGLVAGFWYQGERFLAANGPTFDEPAHLTAGLTYWTTGDFRVNPEHPPLLKLWWALPAASGGLRPPLASSSGVPDHWQAGNALLFESGIPPAELLTPARRMNLAVGCGIVLLAGWWAYRLWGRLAGLAAAAFAASDPTLQSLSCVLSTDAGLAFCTLLSSYLLWEYAGRPSRPLLIATGVSLGLLLSTKFSAVGVVAGLAVAGGVYVLRGGVLALPGVTPAGDRGRPAVELAFRLGVIAAVTLAATYAFVGFAEWGKGLKFQLSRSAAGGEFYLLGDLSRTGWYHYFLVAVALKLPLGMLIGALCGTLSPTTPTGSYRWAMSVPVVFFALASYSRVDLGVRVVLPAVVFLYVVAGRLAAPGPYRGPRLAVLAGCLGWSAVAGWQSSPNQLTYRNELAGGQLVLADSNVDWGQALPQLREYLDREGIDAVYLAYFGTDRPEAHGIRHRALPGYGRIGPFGGESTPPAVRTVVAVSLTHLAGLYLPEPGLYASLRDRRPAAVVGGAIAVYDLADDPDAARRLQSLR